MGATVVWAQRENRQKNERCDGGRTALSMCREEGGSRLGGTGRGTPVRKPINGTGRKQFPTDVARARWDRPPFFASARARPRAQRSHTSSGYTTNVNWHVQEAELASHARRTTASARTQTELP